MAKVNELNRKTFEHSFEQFPRVEQKINEPENYQAFVKRKEFKTNGKIVTARQKDRLTFSSLVFQINTAQK